MEFYQQTIETNKKKLKKDSSAANGGHSSVPSNQTLLGYVSIPVSAIESSQPVEKWYKLETPTGAGSSSSNGTISEITNSSVDLSSTSGAGSVSMGGGSIGVSNGSSVSSIANSLSSLTTTQSFSKDSISIRIKAKYQSVDILPIVCYSRLIEVGNISF